MPDDLRLETNFEHYISRKLNELSDSGWQISENDNGFDADTALYMDDFISYIMATAPQKIEKMKKDLGGSWKSNLEKNLVHRLEVDGFEMDSLWLGIRRLSVPVITRMMYVSRISRKSMTPIFFVSCIRSIIRRLATSHLI